MYEILKEKDFESFYELYKERSLIDILGELRDYLNYRCYYKVGGNGEIYKKDINIHLISLVFSKEKSSKEEIKEFFEKGIYFEERQKLKKIDRMSSFSFENLDKNIYKVFFNRDTSIGLRYAKEYYLRDKNKFNKKLAKYVLLDRVDSKKALVLIAMFKLLKEVKNDRDLDTVLHIFLSYIINYPSVLEEDDVSFENKVEKDLYALAYSKLINFTGEESFDTKLYRYMSKYNAGKIDEKLYGRLSEYNELY
jgi:hypothetical protein